MKKTLTLLGLLLVAAISFSFESITDVKTSLYEELNALRSNKGLNGVTYNMSLEQSAQNWVYQLSQDNVTHDLKRSTGQFKGEVILMYEGELRSERLLSEFMNSPSHKQIILNSDYHKVGIGIKRTEGANYVVIRFI